ncbi:MAG: PilW family protein [Burkholderiaceae bacterium]
MTRSLSRRQSGFSLAEIMVGMVIGMLAIIVVMQLFAISEQRKRTTTGAGDAQSSGAIAFDQIQRDISVSGYGFTSNIFGCPTTWPAPTASIATAIPLAPVTINPAASIIPAGDANTDTLLVIYGNTNGQPQGNPVNGSPTGAVFPVQMPSAFSVGEKVIAATSAWSSAAACTTALSINSIAATSTTDVTLSTAATGTVVYNLGQQPVARAYAIRNGNLTVCDYFQNDCGSSSAANLANPAIWVPVANNIVSMRAVYGRDTAVGAMDGFADTWDQPVTPPSTSCDWARISAVQIALVSRSAQYDKDPNYSAPTTTWARSATYPINLSTNTEWAKYHYRVFESIIPIRNVGWLGVPTVGGMAQC